MNAQNIVILTGAGISAESGLATFRDAINGLWNNHKIEDVCTASAFVKNPKQVLDFYNYRRTELAKVKPNPAHYAITELQKHFRVHIITQNVDDLHERAGNTQITHLHGELLKMRSISNSNITFPTNGDIHIGNLAPDGTQLRPHIVWFEEEVPKMANAAYIVSQATSFWVVGTSLQVYPAASLIDYVPSNSSIYVIDKELPNNIKTNRVSFIKKPASEGLPELVHEFIAKYT
jgi:NAD-dependent deacetylase